MKQEIHFATGNEAKFRSASLKNDTGVELVQVKLDLVEPQADSAIEAAIFKAKQAFEILKKPVIVEDSSFHIEGLGGFPGVYAKYVISTIGPRGILKLAEGLDIRRCGFVGALAYADEKGEIKTFEDRNANGKLALDVDNTVHDKAWSDLWRIFIPDGYDKPLSALSSGEYEERNKKWEEKSVFSQFFEWFKTTRV